MFSYSLQCSATCGGGVRVRSVRCLDEDGIVRENCATPSLRPASFEFCNQIDCITGSELEGAILTINIVLHFPHPSPFSRLFDLTKKIAC